MPLLLLPPAPLLLQDAASWRRDGVQGLLQVVLYALPELDGAIDTVVLGGLDGDRIALAPFGKLSRCAIYSRWQWR